MARLSREALLSYRASILPVRQKSQEEIDKQVLTISSAALGLSLTFYKDVLKDQLVHDGWLLLLAWILWIIAICSVVFSMFLSAEAVRLTRIAIDRAINKVDENEFSPSATQSLEPPPLVELDFALAGGWASRLLPWTNLLSLGVFLLGIICFAMVFLLNLRVA
jgi:hypothetical protein